MNPPLVSVLMPVYNAEKYLKEAIKSILGQSFNDFEFIIIDDGSTDKSSAIIKSHKDPRIKYKRRENKGLVTSLNEGLTMARGKYIARQDADDISTSDRLAKQVQYMESHPSVGLLGSNYAVIDSKGKKNGSTDVFTDPGDLKLAEIVSNQFGHGSVILRKSVFSKSGVYDPSKIAEDFDLWVRISHNFDIANLKECLYMWRSTGEGLSTSPEKLSGIDESVRQIRIKGLKHYMAHKKDYKLFSFHPMSTAGGVRKYFIMKNTLFRDIALLYCYLGLRRYAPLFLLLAAIYAPWIKKTYRQLFVTLFRKRSIDFINYDYI